MLNTLGFELPALLVLLVTLLLAWWVVRRTGTSLAPRHLRVVAGLRLLSLAALVCALAAPVWRGQSHDVSVVYALDVSHSVAPQFVDAALSWIEDANRRGHPAQSRVVAFAEGAQTVADAAAARMLHVTEQDGVVDPLNQSATNIERAMDVALLGFEPNSVKRLVLMSDGNATDGNLWRGLMHLRTQGVRVFTVAAKSRGTSAVRVEAIDTPVNLWRNGPMGVVVRIVSERSQPVRVTLRDGTRVLGARHVVLKSGENEISIEGRIDHAGSATLSADVTVDGDPKHAVDRLQRGVWVGSAPRLLYIEGEPASARFLRDALSVQGIDVVVKEAGDTPDTVAGFDDYDAVLLSDVAAERLEATRMQALESWVRDSGGGLLFAAGQSTYGEKSPDEKGYAGTRVEKILPLQFKAQEKKKDLAMVIAIDRSYSMKGRKMNFAKEAARATLDLLEEQHRLAVIAFDSQPNIAVPMQPLRAKRKVDDLISRIQASGQTNIYPALQLAYRMLNEQDVKAKHVILLSDGDTTPADFQRLVTRMAAAKITVSTVTLAGDGADQQLMTDIARWGQGRTYLVEEVENLPQIFIDETKKAVRSNLVENPFRPLVKRKVQALNGVDFAKAPELKGYVSTKVRDTAELLLVSDSGAPILARWQYGLGRTVAFTSDVKNRWSADWLGWRGYGKLWAQLVRDTMRRPEREELAFDVARVGNEALLTLSALTAEGRFVTGLQPRVRISSAEKSSRTVELGQYAPGHYRLRVPIHTGATPVKFELLDSPGLARSAIARVGTRSLHYPIPDEYNFVAPNLELLKIIAQETGGRYAPDARDVFADLGDVSERRIILWPWLACLALLAYLVEIFLRRAPFAWRVLGS